MIHPKGSFRNLIKRGIRNRQIKLYISIQSQKLEVLKNAGLFNEFPVNDIIPTLHQYKLKTKADKSYFDFYTSVTAISNPDYIPAPTYLLSLEPSLNDFRFVKTIENKALYDKDLLGVITPRTVLRKINGFFYDNNYNQLILSENFIKDLVSDYDKLVLKAAVDSGGGINLKFFTKREGRFYCDNVQLTGILLNQFPDFVLQEVIVQHDFFRQFNPSSNNTLRILTYKSVKDNDIHILHCLLRVGKVNSLTDHDNLGGVVVGITKEGTLNDFGCDFNGIKFSNYNGINLLSLKSVPFLNEVKSMAMNIANQVYYARLLAIDFTIDKAGNPILLEINASGNGTCQYQMNNGSLFNDYTNEIIEFCISKQSPYFLKI